MTAQLWAKITELPIRFTEAVISALVLRETLRQIDRLPRAVRLTVQHRRELKQERAANLRAARICLDAAAEYHQNPADWIADFRALSETYPDFT